MRKVTNYSVSSWATDLTPDEFAAAKQKTPEPLINRQAHCTERIAAELNDQHLQ